jgi:hypothetical protein
MAGAQSGRHITQPDDVAVIALGYASEGAMTAYAADGASASRPDTALASLAPDGKDAAAQAATSETMSGTAHADMISQAFASRWKLWGAAYGGGERVDGDDTAGSAALTASNWGVASGVTRSFDGSALGIALGGAGASFSLADGLGSGHATSFNAGIVGSLDLTETIFPVHWPTAITRPGPAGTSPATRCPAASTRTPSQAASRPDTVWTLAASA